MSRQTQMNMPITDSQEEETMHLFDAEARGGRSPLRSGDLRRRPDQPEILRGATPRQPCRWYRLSAVQGSGGRVRQAFAPGMRGRRTDEAQEYRRLADILTKETSLNH